MAYNEFKLSGDTKGDWGTYDHPLLLVSVGWPLWDCPGWSPLSSWAVSPSSSSV